jgi:hypothetical protein
LLLFAKAIEEGMSFQPTLFFPLAAGFRQFIMFLGLQLGIGSPLPQSLDNYILHGMPSSLGFCLDCRVKRLIC